MRTDHWQTKVISRHRVALNRQVTEGVKIINEGVSNLLNSKNEFGANNLTELVMQNGHKIAGANKRKLNDPTIKADFEKKEDVPHIKVEECDEDEADVDHQKPARKRQKSVSDPEEDTGTVEIIDVSDVDDKYDDADNKSDHDVDANSNIQNNEHVIDHDSRSRNNGDNNKKT